MRVRKLYRSVYDLIILMSGFGSLIAVSRGWNPHTALIVGYAIVAIVSYFDSYTTLRELDQRNDGRTTYHYRIGFFVGLCLSMLLPTIAKGVLVILFVMMSSASLIRDILRAVGISRF